MMKSERLTGDRGFAQTPTCCMARVLHGNHGDDNSFDSFATGSSTPRRRRVAKAASSAIQLLISVSRWRPQAMIAVAIGSWPLADRDIEAMAAATDQKLSVALCATRLHYALLGTPKGNFTVSIEGNLRLVRGLTLMSFTAFSSRQGLWWAPPENLSTIKTQVH